MKRMKSMKRHLPLAWLMACLIGGGLLMAKGTPPSRGPRYVTKNIEDVRVGDWVLAKDPDKPGLPTPHRVMDLPRNWTEHLVHVRLEGGGDVAATRNHPFFVRDRGWVEARDLRVGDRLRDGQDRLVGITGLSEEARTCDTFNLTVQGVHTYYVLAGRTPVLVHNMGDDPPPWVQQQMWDQDLEEGADAHDLDYWGGDGVVYRVPGEGTPSGRPYIGSSDNWDQRQKFSGDGRDRSMGEQIGRYPKGDNNARKNAEQNGIDDEGGLSKTDNKRNEIRRRSCG